MIDSKVHVETKPGEVIIYVEGNDPSQPWKLIFNPEGCYQLSNMLFRAAVESNGGNSFPVSSTAGNKSQPVKKQPSTGFHRQRRLQQAQDTGPKSSVDGIPGALVGDSFE